MRTKTKRYHKNPIIIPSDVKPSNPDFQVECVFNAGVTRFKDEIIMLLRVAESVKSKDNHVINVPLLEENRGDYELVIRSYHKKNDLNQYNFSDSRALSIIDETGKKRVVCLTTLSHLRIARSKDGKSFKVDDIPFVFPYGKYETWGIEDPRITKMEDTYYINYTAVSELGAATALIKTEDFKDYERLGIIFPPENKDVTIFPEKINGLYYAYHRPVPNEIGNPDIWVASSKDLIHWGRHQHLMGVKEQVSWENGRLGGGAPSIKTEKGWLHIYHAADKNSRYCLGAFITSIDDPSKVIAKTHKPILEPEETYEINGYFDNVVFTCGALMENDIVMIYYGGADQVMAMAEIELEDLYQALGI